MILYIDHQISRPDEDAGSLWAHTILRALGHEVSVFADEWNPPSHHLRQLAELDIAVAPRGGLAERLADAALRPDVVIVARVNVAGAPMLVLRAHLPGVPEHLTSDCGFNNRPRAAIQSVARRSVELGPVRSGRPAVGRTSGRGQC